MSESRWALIRGAIVAIVACAMVGWLCVVVDMNESRKRTTWFVAYQIANEKTNQEWSWSSMYHTQSSPLFTSESVAQIEAFAKNHHKHYTNPSVVILMVTKLDEALPAHR